MSLGSPSILNCVSGKISLSLPFTRFIASHVTSIPIRCLRSFSAVSNIAVIDIEKQNRLSKIISLYSKGLNQEEIAQLFIDQSTVCRDLQYIKHEARIKIEKYLRDDILFEYVRYMAGSNEITRHLWEIVQDNETNIREKTNALSCLMQSYNSRLQTLTSGPESYMNIKKSLSGIDLQRLVDSSPVLKAQVNQRKLF